MRQQKEIKEKRETLEASSRMFSVASLQVQLLIVRVDGRLLAASDTVTTLGHVVASAVGELGDGILSIEQGSGLLEGTSLGLGGPEPDVDEFEDEPAAVDEVVLPLEGVEGDGVGVLIEDDGTHDGEVHDSETLGTNEERQDLDGVGDEEGRVGDGVETVEDEDEGEEGTSCTDGLGIFVSGGHGGNDGVRDEHAGGGDDPEWATAGTFNVHRGGDGNDEVVDGEDTVDEGLVGGVGDSNTVEHLEEVVRDKTVSRPLGEDTNTDDDPHAATVTGSTEEIEPVDASSLGFESKSLLNLVVLESDDGVRDITISVPPGNDVLGLLVTALVDQPTRGFREEPDEEELDDGGETLESRGHTPRPVTVDAESTEGGPGSNDGTREPERVVERSERSTVGWVGDLGDEERRGHLCEGGTETDKETRADEHAEVLGGSLEDSTNHDNSGTEEDTGLASESISDIGRQRDGDEGTDGLNGIEQTEILGFGVVEVSLPVRNRLETVHHGTIETVGVRGDEGDEEQEVKLDNVAMLPPFASVQHALVNATRRSGCDTSIGSHLQRRRRG